MKRICLLSLLSVVFIHLKAQIKNIPLQDTPSFSVDSIEKDALVFFVVGDWGRMGRRHQKEVARAMETCAALVKPAFVVSTGDNFYTYGVKSVDDPKWQRSFEEVYSGDALQVPWHPVLGNHDYYGNVQAQIEYSRKSERWKFPAPYYTFVKQAEGPTRIRFLFLDTNPLVRRNRKKGNMLNPQKPFQDTLQQWKWMDSVCITSREAKEEWRIVVGHHPVYSSSPRHGDTKVLWGHLKPRMESYQVQVYFCGHDHNLQHQKPKGSPVDYFLSGAGSEVRKSGSDEHTLFAKSIPGFAIVSIKGDVLSLYYIDKDAKIAYRYERKR